LLDKKAKALLFIAENKEVFTTHTHHGWGYQLTGDKLRG
jgi:hypothetical protein